MQQQFSLKPKSHKEIKIH